MYRINVIKCTVSIKTSFSLNRINHSDDKHIYIYNFHRFSN